MIHVIEVNEDSNIDEILEKVRESIMDTTSNVDSIQPSGIKIKDRPLDQGLTDIMTFMLTGKEPEKIDPEYTEFEDILRETISTSLLKKAIHEFEIVKNYIKDFDSGDIRWDEKVDVDFDDREYLDQFKSIVSDLISEHLKILNLMDYDILNQMEDIIFPIISEKLLPLIDHFKEKYQQYKYDEQATQEEELRAEQESIRAEQEEELRAEQESMKAEYNPERLEVYIVVKHDFIILTRYLDECHHLGCENHSRNWLTEAYMTHYKGEDYIFTEKDRYYTKIEAIQRITQLDSLY